MKCSTKQTELNALVSLFKSHFKKKQGKTKKLGNINEQSHK